MKRFAVMAFMLTALLASVLTNLMAPAGAQQAYPYPYYQAQPSSGAYQGYTRVYRSSPVTYPATYQGYQVSPIAQNTEIPVSLNGLSSPETILNRLKAANNIPAAISPQIKIQESSVLNAGTNGQQLIITSGLLNKLHTNDQRAFVISHELSHIVLQHIAKTQVRHVGLGLLDQLFVRRYVAQGSLADLAAQLGISMYDKRSSRIYEYQADDLGVKLMTQAGYNPQAAIQVFDILQAATPANRTPAFLQDHPITQDRMRALVQKYKLSPS